MVCVWSAGAPQWPGLGGLGMATKLDGQIGGGASE